MSYYGVLSSLKFLKLSRTRSRERKIGGQEGKDCVRRSKREKVKFILEQAVKAQRGSRGISLFFPLTSALDEGGLSTPRPGRFTPGRRDPVPIVKDVVQNVRRSS